MTNSVSTSKTGQELTGVNAAATPPELPVPITLHRPAPMDLPNDSLEATAQVLAHLHGNEAILRAAAMEAMTLRIVKLVDADGQNALTTLACQLPILEALFHRYCLEAKYAKLPDHKSKLLRIALNAQTSYSRTQALIAGLQLQRQDKAHINVNLNNDAMEENL